MKNKVQKAYFSGGCFWGVENFFQNLRGFVSTRVGYMGGKTDNPTYEKVCRGDTGHAETLEIVFDANEIDFETLAKIFFEIHDATQKNRQGPDSGNQYRSAIFYVDEEQKGIADKLVGILKEKGIEAMTEISPAKNFYAAEEHHQKYYLKSGNSSACQVRKKIF